MEKCFIYRNRRLNKNIKYNFYEYCCKHECEYKINLANCVGLNKKFVQFFLEARIVLPF